MELVPELASKNRGRAFQIHDFFFEIPIFRFCLAEPIFLFPLCSHGFQREILDRTCKALDWWSIDTVHRSGTCLVLKLWGGERVIFQIANLMVGHEDWPLLGKLTVEYVEP